MRYIAANNPSDTPPISLEGRLIVEGSESNALCQAHVRSILTWNPIPRRKIIREKGLNKQGARNRVARSLSCYGINDACPPPPILSQPRLDKMWTERHSAGLETEEPSCWTRLERVVALIEIKYTTRGIERMNNAWGEQVVVSNEADL